MPPFIDEGGIAIESLSLLLIHFLTSFFHSPYLPTAGERLSSAISLTQSLLQTTRDLSNPSARLQKPLSTRVWCELIRSLADGVRIVSSRLMIPNFLKFYFEVACWLSILYTASEKTIVRCNLCFRSDAYGRATSGTLAQNLLGVIVFVRAISG